MKIQCHTDFACFGFLQKLTPFDRHKIIHLRGGNKHLAGDVDANPRKALCDVTFCMHFGILTKKVQQAKVAKRWISLRIVLHQ